MNDATRRSQEAHMLSRAWHVYAGIDPGARKVLQAKDPWDAYDAAYECIEVLDEHLNRLPMSDSIWISWMWAVDIFELRTAPVEVAHGVLRRMASGWLRRPAEPDVDFLRKWAADSESAISDATDPGQP